MENPFFYHTVDDVVIKICLSCLSLLPSCPRRAVWSCRGRGWDYTSGSVRDAALGESICQAPEPFERQLAPYLAALQALVLPGHVHSQRQGFALCLEVLPFRIPELFPKMPAPPRPARSPGQGCPFSRSLVQPCGSPGWVLFALLIPSSARKAFPGLSLLSLSFCTDTGHSLFCRHSKCSELIRNAAFESCLSSSFPTNPKSWCSALRVLQLPGSGAGCDLGFGSVGSAQSQPSAAAETSEESCV